MLNLELCSPTSSLGPPSISLGVIFGEWLDKPMRASEPSEGELQVSGRFNGQAENTYS